ncbi:MAG: iron export ABC transporter permease subunit FetB [Alphaproteobacteria bacterium]
MMFIPLGYGDLALAALLLLANAALSIVLRLSVERQLLVAGLRMVVQLAFIGFVLEVLFDAVSLLWTSLLALVMAAFAGHEILRRQERRFAGPWGYSIGAASMLLAGTAVTILALTTQLQPDPWYHPRYAIPLLGMILGNAMTGVSLGLDQLSTTAARERLAIEARLSLGATRVEALANVLRRSLRSGLIPIINAMAAAGLVWLPGMMTGQILAGVDPLEAVKYQILILFLIAGATGLGVFAAVYLGAYRLTDDRHRLRLDRLVVSAPPAKG